MSVAALTPRYLHPTSPEVWIHSAYATSGVKLSSYKSIGMLECMWACSGDTSTVYSQSSLRWTNPWVQEQQEHAPGAWYEYVLGLGSGSPPRDSAAALSMRTWSCRKQGQWHVSPQSCPLHYSVPWRQQTVMIHAGRTPYSHLHYLYEALQLLVQSFVFEVIKAVLQPGPDCMNDPVHGNRGSMT